MPTHKDVSVYTRDITPQDAQAILAANGNNRNVRQTRVDTYARDMANSKWLPNGASFVFDKKGHLVDGQHRLHAIIRANKTLHNALVVDGIADEAHRSIDTGLARSFADELKWRGEKNVGELGAVLNLVWKYEDGSITDPRVASRSDLWALLKRAPSIRESLKAVAVGRDTKIRPTALSATHYLVAEEHGNPVADAFLEHLASGTDYTDGDPCLVLRNYAVNVAGTRLTKPTTIDWFARCMKAANAWLLGNPVRQLNWRRVGKHREPFPTLVTREQVGELDPEEL